MLKNILCILCVLILFQKFSHCKSVSNTTKKLQTCEINDCILNCIYGTISTIASDINTALLDATNCKFYYLLISTYKGLENNIISKDWFSGVYENLRINRVIIQYSDIYKIDDGAFDSIQFTEIKEIFFINLKLEYLTNHLFAGLNKVESLMIAKIPLKYIDRDVLLPMINSLNVLHIENVETSFSMENLTGFHKLNNLIYVNLEENNFGDSLDGNSFSGLENLERLNLRTCEISHLHQNTFAHFGKNFKYLTLHGNNLTTLAPEVLQPIIKNDKKMYISLTDNLFICDCNLLGLQRQMIIYESHFGKPYVTCRYPGESIDYKIIEADLCN